MAQYPAFPLWTDAYLADTGHLTTIEHGAYLLLLMTMWRAKGCLPNDDRQLAKFARMTPAQWSRIKPAIMPFFEVSPDSLTQGRLTDELVFVKRNSKKQSDAAQSRWLKNKGKGDATALPETKQALPEACQINAPTPTPIPSKGEPKGSLSETSSDQTKKARKKPSYSAEFEAFWSEYPRTKNMGKTETFVEWRKLDADDQRAACSALPAFKAFLDTKPDLEKLHACRFLSKRRFEGYLEQSAASAPKPVTEDEWLKRLGYARRKSEWHVRQWGPIPGQVECQAPEHLLQPTDGQGWAVWDA